MTHTNVCGMLPVLEAMCKRIGSARALTIVILIRHGEIRELLDLGINPSEYNCVDLFRNDYLLTKYLSKWTGHEVIQAKERSEEALRVWLNSEKLCLKTNEDMRSVRSTYCDVNGILYLAQRKIAEILGPFPGCKVWFDKCSWSNGGTNGLRRGSTFVQKMTPSITTTPGALRYMSHLVGGDPHWYDFATGNKLVVERLDGPCCLVPSAFKVLKGNRLTVVPKTAKVDRCICIEPTANIFLQKGIGALIRERLMSRGVNLDDQTVNQSLASIAEKAQLATIDLQSASDTVSFELVKTLIPHEWFFHMDAIRSKYTEVPSAMFKPDKPTHVKLEKFSSMGNGYTFELESLIFYALAWSVCKAEGLVNWYTSTYGDDLIVPSAAYPRLSDTLQKCGFIVNDQKSFASGAFYESCGKHYFQGCLVTPVYQKKLLDSREESIRAHNRLYRWSVGSATWFPKAMNIITKHYMCYGDKHVPRVPEWCDDRGFLVPNGVLRRLCVNRGYLCDTYSAYSRNVEVDNEAFLAYKLRCPGQTSSDPKGHSSLGIAKGYRHRKQWISLIH